MFAQVEASPVNCSVFGSKVSRGPMVSGCRLGSTSWALRCLTSRVAASGNSGGGGVRDFLRRRLGVRTESKHWRGGSSCWRCVRLRVRRSGLAFPAADGRDEVRVVAPARRRSRTCGSVCHRAGRPGRIPGPRRCSPPRTSIHIVVPPTRGTGPAFVLRPSPGRLRSS